MENNDDSNLDMFMAFLVYCGWIFPVIFLILTKYITPYLLKFFETIAYEITNFIFSLL